jgi:diacylglycerol O-acyltransferase / wax synthase
VPVARSLTFDSKMSDAEGLMWRLEKDPFLSSTFANITITDGPIDIERFRRRMERATIAVPRLRQRVQPAMGNFAPPSWVDDPEFSITRHVRHVALPAPGSLRQLQDLATLIAADPFDRTRPLWEFVVVDGLRGGKGALIQKLHHTVADGEGSIKLSLQFLDLERGAPEPEPLVYEPSTPAEAPHVSDIVHTLVNDALRVPLNGLRQVATLLTDPVQLPAAAQSLAATASSVMRQLNDTDPHRSPLWTARSLDHEFEILRTPLEPIKKAAKRLGGTLNTAFMTVAAEASGAYHREKGSPVEELRTSMAISTRKSESGSNAFSLVRFLIPTGEMSIQDRFARTTAAIEAARTSAGPASLNRLAVLTTSLPTSMLTRMARTQAQAIDFATSNVRAAPFPVYISGTKVLQNHPVGPLGGVAFNLTLMSYDGSLDMGLNTDRAAIEDPALLRSLLMDAFRRFSKAR